MATTIGLKIDDGLRERLKHLGEAKDRSSHWLMKQAITEYLEREERREAERQEDEARWQAYLDSGESIGEAEMDAFIGDLIQQAKDAQH